MTSGQSIGKMDTQKPLNVPLYVGNNAEHKSPVKVAQAGTWRTLGSVCDYVADRGGTNFQKKMEYTVELSSDSCAEFKLRNPLRTKESITSKLTAMPVLTANEGKQVTANVESTMKRVEANIDTTLAQRLVKPDSGANNFNFRVTSIPMLNRILAEEMMVKPCRCKVASCKQTIDLTIRHLHILSGKSKYKQMYSSERTSKSVIMQCDYTVNVEPTGRVGSGGCAYHYAFRPSRRRSSPFRTAPGRRRPGTAGRPPPSPWCPRITGGGLPRS